MSNSAAKGVTDGVIWIEAVDCIAVPNLYLPDFQRDPRDALLKYGSQPQRAKAPWFTQVGPIDECLMLPDLVCGSAAECQDPKLDFRALVAAPQETALLDGISPHFSAGDLGYWHVSIDNALGKNREGDSAGIAMGRVVAQYAERSLDERRQEYVRYVKTYEVPLVAQIIARPGDQIYTSSIIRFILQLKQLRGFNITSFSVDGFSSAQLQQELMLAGLVTAGMHIDENTGDVTGLPKPYSVDRSPQAYKDLLEAVNEVRVALPRYSLLRRELRELEFIQPDRAPDHPVGGSKDVADAVSGVIGYLSLYGHAELRLPTSTPITGKDLHDILDLPPPVSFATEGETEEAWSRELLTDPVNFETF